MLTLIRSFSVVLAALTLSVTAEAQTWLQVRKGAYIINYQSGYEQDLPLATRWMDAGEALAGSKFRIPPPTVRLWLEPNPMKWAGVGSATAVPGGNKSTDIYVLTPSASAWKNLQPGTRTTVGLPFDEHTHAKLLVHEYTHAIQVSLPCWSGKNCKGEPSWYSEGLAEFNGLMHSDEYNRTTGLRATLVNKGFTSFQGQSSTIVCCLASFGGQRLTVGGDPYTGGVGVVLFLQSQFGADIHRRIYEEAALSNFWSALEKETGRSIPSLWSSMRKWFDSEIRTLSP